jgi:hypothetical protein
MHELDSEGAHSKRGTQPPYTMIDHYVTCPALELIHGSLSSVGDGVEADP